MPFTRMTRVSLVFLAACLLLFLGPAARAQQNTAAVVGTVTDTSGAVVPGATVTITNTGTNISQTVTSSADGDYTFTLLQVGAYTVQFKAKGFKIFFAKNIALSAGDRARIDAKLEIGEATQTVEVYGTVAPALQTDTSTMGTLVTTQAVEDIPLNGRNFIKLVQLQPGVNEGQPNSIQQGGRPDDRRQTAGFSANGQLEQLNNNLIDGMDNNERIIGTIGVRPSVDAIQEVSVSTNLYDASVSRTAGGVVDVITKSGTNAYHGSAYEFFRNAVLNTNPNWFSGAAKPGFRQNQFGGSVGGPIRKNKTFFFGDFEELKYALGQPFLYTVPTKCERGLAVCPDGLTHAGDFSDNPSISALNGSSGACVLNASQVTPSNPLYGSSACPYVVMNPMGSGITTGAAGQTVYPITPLGNAFFNMYPVPNNGASGALINNYVSDGAKTQDSKTFDVRIDEHFSDRNSLWGRYSFNNVNSVLPGGLPEVTITPAIDPLITSPVTVHPGSGSGGTAAERQQNLALSYVHVFGSNLVLNLKAAYMKSSIASLPLDYGIAKSTMLGFPCNAVSCINQPGNQYTTGLVDVYAGSYVSLGASLFVPLLQYDNMYQYTGVVTWNKGAHGIRMGTGFIRRQATIGQSAVGTGAYSFSGALTGLPGGDLLAGFGDGSPFSLGERADTLVAPGFRTWEPSAYFQDDWRARRWLTVNMGVRYDIYTPYTERRGRLVNFDPANGVLVSPSLPGINQSSSTGNVATNYLDIAPRLGFAATLKHSMVVRGGFGLSFYPNNYQSAFAFKNAPYSFSVNCQVQNQGGTNASCSGLPLGAPASVVAQYGSAPGPGSKVNGAGFAAMPLGIPTPTLDISKVITPAGCNVPFQTSTPACKAPTNPYASSAIGSIVWPKFPWPYLEQFNLQVEKAFSDNVVTIGYVGELGIHQPSNLVLNSITNPTQTARPLAGEFPWLATNNINPNYNEGKSSYHALQVSFERRFSHGLTANVNYTWAHALVNSFSQSGAGGAGGAGCTPSISPQDLGFGTAPKTPINPCFYDTPGKLGTTTVVSTLTSWYSVGNSTEDVHDRIGGTINYEVPFGKSLTGVEGIFAKGWTLNAAGSWQTGLPFTVAMGINVTNTPTTGSPDQICSGRATNPSISNWINANCFQKPAQGLFGDEHANQLFGPSQRVLNFSFFKTFSLTESLRLQFRTEVFNLFNTPNFSVPAPTLTNFNSSNIAQNTNGNGTFVAPITSLNPSETPRQIQFALKFLF